MSRLLGATDRDPKAWHGYREEPGELVDGNEVLLQGGIERVGREVEVIRDRRRLTDGPLIDGWVIRIRTFGEGDRDLGTLTRWIVDGGDPS